MRNATVVLATTFALVTTGLTVEIARRHAAAEAKSSPPIANAEAPALVAKADGAAKPEAPDAANQTPVPAALGAEKPLAPPTPTEAASTEPLGKASEDGPPMRDASPLMPNAAPPIADAKRSVESIAKPYAEKAAEGQRALFAIPQGPAAAEEGQQHKAKVETKESKGADKTAIVKPAIGRPASGKSGTEKAAIEKKAAAAPSFEGDAVRDRAERHAARHPVHIVKWQGGYGVGLAPGGGVYGFSGSFGGCHYRGVVSMTGYRIERSC
jgi:hypothetical protein